MSDRIRMVIDAAFKHGDIVQHRMDDDDTKGIIVAIVVGPHGLHYRVAWHHSDESECYELELTHAEAKAET